MELPPFPVDPVTLDNLAAALDPVAAGDTAAQRSCVGEFLDLMSRLGGADPQAVASDDGRVRVMRDPGYHINDVLTALVCEIRRLRGA